MHDLAKTHATFDDPHLVSHGGLVPVMALAQRAGLGELVAENVRIGRRCGVNAHLKVPCLAAGMIAGAHLPSGCFPASAAWLACAAISHNLLRAAGSLASLTCAKARAATLRRDLIGVAARIARHGRGHITLHLPEGWHRQAEWMNLFEAACGPPAAPA